MPFFLEVYWPTKLVVTLECGTPLSVRIFNILYFGSIRYDIIELSVELGGRSVCKTRPVEKLRKSCSRHL